MPKLETVKGNLTWIVWFKETEIRLESDLTISASPIISSSLTLSSNKQNDTSTHGYQQIDYIEMKLTILLLKGNRGTQL